MIFKYCPNCGKENESNSENFKCNNCGKSYYQNSKPTASVIPVFQNKEILMSVRKIDPRAGKLDFVGGFLSNGEDPLDGAFREFEEETGYQLKKEDLEFINMKVDSYKFQDDTLFTLNITYFINFPEKLKLSPKDDVAELVWFNIEDEIDHAFSYQAEVLEELKRKLHT